MNPQGEHQLHALTNKIAALEQGLKLRSAREEAQRVASEARCAAAEARCTSLEKRCANAESMIAKMQSHGPRPIITMGEPPIVEAAETTAAAKHHTTVPTILCPSSRKGHATLGTSIRKTTTARKKSVGEKKKNSDLSNSSIVSEEEFQQSQPSTSIERPRNSSKIDENPSQTASHLLARRRGAPSNTAGITARPTLVSHEGRADRDSIMGKLPETSINSSNNSSKHESDEDFEPDNAVVRAVVPREMIKRTRPEVSRSVSAGPHSAVGPRMVGKCVWVTWPTPKSKNLGLVVGYCEPERKLKVFYMGDETIEIIGLEDSRWSVAGDKDVPWNSTGMCGKKVGVLWAGHYYDIVDQKMAEEKFGTRDDGYNTKIAYEAFVIKRMDDGMYRLIYTADDTLENRKLDKESKEWKAIPPLATSLDGLPLIMWVCEDDDP